MTEDAKKLLDDDKKDEEEDIEEIYTKLDIVCQPDKMPDLSSLVDKKIKKLFVYKEDSSGNVTDIKWREGTVLDVGTNSDGNTVCEIEWDSEHVGEDEEAVTSELFLSQDWVSDDSVLMEGSWELA